MLTASVKLLAGAAITLLLLSATGTQAAGVCYSPFHAEKYFSEPTAIESVLLSDLAQIANATSFAAVRTYHAQFYGQNVIDAVVANGLEAAIGIQMVGVNGASYSYLADDIAAAVTAAKNHPESVLAIYAGNENLMNGDFGSSSADEIIKVITTVKSALKGTNGANVPVGTVQRLEEWLHATDADLVAAASDVIGVNIYPFFTQGAEADMLGSLDAQWTQITAKFGADKVRLTETGWPTQGSVSAAGNTPSLANAKKYYDVFTQWAKNHSSATPFYFMMYDLLSAHATDYEQHFGMSTASGALKFSLGSSSQNSSQASAASQSQALSSASYSASAGSAGSSASAASMTSSSRTEEAGVADDSEVAGEADRSADELFLATTEATPTPSSTVLVSSAIGNAINSTSTSGSVATSNTTESIPATSAPSTPSEVSSAPAATSTLPSVDDAGGVANGSGLSDVEDVSHGSSASSFSGSIGSSNSSSTSAASNGPDVGDVGNNNAPVAAPDLSKQTVTPVPSPSATSSPSSSASKAKELETQEAQAKRARVVSGNQNWSIQMLTGITACAGIAAIAIIAVYVQKRRNEESENQISVTTADPRDSTPSVYSDPLGTRFSSIVMITPNGDGVCIL